MFSIRSIIHRLPAVAIVAILLTAAPAKGDVFEDLFAPSQDLWDRWSRHDPNALMTIDHRIWNDFLQRYVVEGADGVNRVAYARVSEPDRRALDAYIGSLVATPISRFNRAEQLAYWINLYNALTLKLVLAAYPVDSIRDIQISSGLFSIGPWDRQLVRIEGEAVSLNDIEHRILRPIWRDPRIHYAVNCASIGCPNLVRAAFTAANAKAHLDAAARDFINHPRAVRVEHGYLVVSSIYSWFTEDFGDSDAGVLEHLRQYAEPELASRLAPFDVIMDDEDDWSLNEAR